MLEKLPESLGAALQGQRAGIEGTVLQRLSNAASLLIIEVSSSAFDVHRPIPSKYTADGAGLSPPLQWQGVPEEASQLVVMVEDADSPTPNPLVHAIVVIDDLRESSLVEGALNSPDHTGVGLHTGRNSYLAHAWLPPDPPPGHGLHHYVFQVFALRGKPITDSPGRHEVARAVEAHAVAAGQCIGVYGRGEKVTVTEAAIATDETSVPELMPA